jgi:signal transduction histidine kinase
MHVTLPMPLLKRIPPGVWTTLPWCAGLAFIYLARGGLWSEFEHGAPFARVNGPAYVAGTSVLILAGSALLRRRPPQALALLLAAMLAGVPLGVSEMPVAQLLAVDVGLYYIGANTTRRTGTFALAGAITVLTGSLSIRLLLDWSVSLAAELALVTTAIIAWLVGHTVRQKREHAQAKITWATAQAVTEERLRISRELHDTIAHNIGVIALQAGAARRVIATQPERAVQALGDIEKAGRDTLSGLRRTLGSLRRNEPATPLHPTPGLADVDRLAAATTDAGVRVEVHWVGAPRPLPPEIDMSAYRIIQEAITNVVRHAGTDGCRVSVEYLDDELTIEILDSGCGPRRTADSGYGLVGMRERVSLLQGRFSAGPSPEGGFRVTARLPLPAGAR